jgi:hypothetical protein
VADIEKMKAQEAAIVEGIERAARVGLSKPYDVFICILSELKEAGLMIVWQPGEKPKR